MTEVFPPSEDGYERLWTPHRGAYIGGESKPATSGEDDCPFCLAHGGDDETKLIVARGESTFVLLNLYPYNSGHLLVCTNRHVAAYVDLTPGERQEMGEMTARAMRTLSAVYEPAGFNLGMNQGAVAGAGIAAHIHQHIVPRWQGDANFFPIVGQTKALPYLLGETRGKLAAAWQEDTTHA